VILEGKKKRYLLDVLRLKPGSRVEVFDGRGYYCEALLKMEDGVWSLVPGERRKVSTDLPATWMGCAVLKGRAFDEVIRMLSEVGVEGLIPVVSERVVPQLQGVRAENRIRRWTTIASEAARQSGRSTVMEIEPLRRFSDVLDALPFNGIILHPEAGQTLRARLDEIGAQDRLLLVGPEGGFSAKEIEQARQSGFSVCSMGVNTLRARTAMVVAAAFSCLGNGQ
jgi:16S rRNA (uracil1498-N3)-methyltransferase